MNYPSRFVFRWLVSVSLILHILGFVVIKYQVFPQSLLVQDALLLNYHEARLSADVIFEVWWLLFVVQIISTLAFIFFLSWSRWILLGSLIAWVVMDPFLGLYVSTAPDRFILGISGLLLWFPLVLSFFPPCSGYFTKRQGAVSPDL